MKNFSVGIPALRNLISAKITANRKIAGKKKYFIVECKAKLYGGNVLANECTKSVKQEFLLRA